MCIDCLLFFFDTDSSIRREMLGFAKDLGIVYAGHRVHDLPEVFASWNCGLTELTRVEPFWYLGYGFEAAHPGKLQQMKDDAFAAVGICYRSKDLPSERTSTGRVLAGFGSAIQCVKMRQFRKHFEVTSYPSKSKFHNVGITISVAGGKAGRRRAPGFQKEYVKNWEYHEAHQDE